MSNIYRTFFVGIAAFGFVVATDHAANGQYPVAVTAVQPVVPAVVGYAPQRRGLLGRRTVYRPVVAPVAAAVPVAASVTVARPVVVEPQVSVGYTPAVAPVRAYYAPPVVAPRVRAYYAAPVVPVNAYRVPVTTYVPVFGY